MPSLVNPGPVSDDVSCLRRQAIASALAEAGFDLAISARMVKPGEAHDNAVSLLESPDAVQYIGMTVDAQDLCRARELYPRFGSGDARGSLATGPGSR